MVRPKMFAVQKYSTKLSRHVVANSCFEDQACIVLSDVTMVGAIYTFYCCCQILHLWKRNVLLVYYFIGDSIRVCLYSLRHTEKFHLFSAVRHRYNVRFNDLTVKLNKTIIHRNHCFWKKFYFLFPHQPWKRNL